MADGNYFDGKNNKEASERVYDKSQDPNLLALRIHNVSVSKPSSCKENGNCNAHGTCVFVRLCVCHPGKYLYECTQDARIQLYKRFHLFNKLFQLTSCLI